MKIKTVLSDMIKVSWGLGVEEILHMFVPAYSQIFQVGNLSVHKQAMVVMLCFVNCIVFEFVFWEVELKFVGSVNLPIPHMGTEVFVLYTSK